MNLCVAGAFVATLFVVGCGGSSKPTVPGDVDTVPPAAISDLTAKVVTGLSAQVTLRWKESPEIDLAGYRVYRSHNGDTPTLVMASDTSTFGDSGVQNGDTYVYQVSAFDESNNESSKVSTGTLVVTPAPKEGQTRDN